jgi:hypothetical protein
MQGPSEQLRDLALALTERRARESVGIDLEEANLSTDHASNFIGESARQRRLAVAGRASEQQDPVRRDGLEGELLSYHHREHALRNESLLDGCVHLDASPRLGEVVVRQVMGGNGAVGHRYTPQSGDTYGHSGNHRRLSVY